ncbi:PfkB family carbohydrate kinase [Paucibacter sediminis]|uniref:PfkB family carbohydrate kinase n=1 Tax=Paucibacter sediminis TaxID=3019553 RepID=A0AA95SWR9_9BURK|nr:PfkB family carbohydrate kinase [Paucibacter sp. S2-9]WIT12334.1 PfkB family carbohydrate kinase [Paucibacter sp. S2-9]
MAPVLLLGEALVDEFASGPVAGGAPLNVARSLQALGQPALLATRLGQGDAGAALVLQSMRRFGLSEAALQFDAERGTGRVSVIENLGEQGGEHRFEIHDDAAWDHLQAEPLLDLLAAPPRLVYFGSLAQRQPVARASIQQLLDQLGRQGALRYLDLNLRAGSATPELAAACLARADWLKVNEHELARLLHWQGLPGPAPDAAPEAWSAGVRALMQHHGLQRLLLTRGALGAVSFDIAGRVEALALAPRQARVVDTVGAGDGFSAMLLAAWLGGQGVSRALALAVRFAAALCGERGAVPARDGFYDRWQQELSPERFTA